MHKTYSARPKDITRAWYIVDASQATLGRVATEVATMLIGKKKPQFTSHVDCGDFVIVINAASLKVTGEKLTDKVYYRHSGFPGGIKSRTLQEQMDIDPTAAIISAVRGMLPVNKLRDGRLKRLKVYAGQDHGHAAQKPVAVELGSERKK